jgi:mxaJ protein
MCSLFLRLFAVMTVVLSGIAAVGQTRELRVCADPNNMPFSNMKQEGFENRIAALVANDLQAHLSYVWQRMGRGFVREYLDKSQCDLLIGVPSSFRPLLTTTPYYRSSYVFVSQRKQNLEPASGFDSPALPRLKIGVQILDEEYTPPGEALARRGLQAEIVGFDTTGDGADSIIEAVVGQRVDVAVVWGPLAGYFTQKYRDSLTLTPVEPEVDPPGLPFTFAISMGVRKGNLELRDELEEILNKRHSQIRAILDEYGVPQLPIGAVVSTSSPVN